MSAKEEVLKTLEENRGEYFSGQQLADSIGVSRNAVWKAVNYLKEEGYEIESVTNKGYCLKENTDILSAEGILCYASPSEIHVYKEIDSTNEEAKRLITKGAPHGTLIVANRQTAGKGRRGRAFFSPADTGIYLSVVLKPDLELTESVLITTAASVAVSKAIENVYGIRCGIKWVNDVYYNEHKICGILTEATADFETGDMQSLIVGIGVNITTKEFPDEVDKVAGALLSQENPGLRCRLCAEIYSELMKMAESLPNNAFMEEYKKRSIVIGKYIRYTKKDGWLTGKAVGIDDNGGLIVDSDTEGRIVLSSGEISIRVNE
ncbi:MAG: biotin--[acetyl-CoA-carboxylase] ligase [Eubacterium sp.]|nr:biotin--[acetyl-CoA-carboxylase] ligase [Eubacterium sp.]